MDNLWDYRIIVYFVFCRWEFMYVILQSALLVHRYVTAISFCESWEIIPEGSLMWESQRDARVGNHSVASNLFIPLVPWEHSVYYIFFG